MKSYFGQFYRNRFPEYSRIRNDDNSVGAKIFDLVGSKMHEPLNFLIKSKREKEVLLNTPVTLPDLFYLIRLNTDSILDSIKDNHFRIFLDSLNTNKSRQKIKIKSLSAKIAENSIECYNADTFDLLFSLPPTRATLSDSFLLDESNSLILETTEKYKSLNYFFNYDGEYIYVTVHKEYDTDKRIFYYSENNPVSNYNGEISVTLRGYDQFMNPIEEKIYIGLKTHYRSKNKFLYLKDLKQNNETDSFGGFAFETSGFESLVELHKYPCYEIVEEVYENELLVNKEYYLKTANDRFFSDAFFNIKDNIFSYYFYTYGNLFISKYNEYPIDYVKRIFYQQNLILPETHTIITYDIDYTRDLLVTLSNKGLLSFFNMERAEFKHPEINRTKYTSLEFENSIQRTKKLNETVYLQLFDRHFTKRNDCILIFRRRPGLKNLGEANFKFEFLNSEFEWIETPYIFKKKQIINYNIPLDHLVENRLSNDIQIPVLFNELGQYDFYVMNYDLSNSNAFEIESKYLSEENYNSKKLRSFFESELDKQEKSELQNELFFELNYHSILVESNFPFKSIQLLNTEENFLNLFENKKISIKFNNVNNSLFFYVNNDTENSVNIYTVFLNFDYIVFDQADYNSTLIMFEEYDSVDVSFQTQNNDSQSLIFKYLKEE